jgi:(p)ppGpp synthase/HD superfamily hydrolase
MREIPKPPQSLERALALIQTELDFQSFFYHYQHHFTDTELRSLRLAYVLSKYGHRAQLRLDNTRYFDHPRMVSFLTSQLFNIWDLDVHILSLVHDTKEDTYLISSDVVAALFSRKMMVRVNLVTKHPDRFKADYIPRLIREGKWEELLVKAVDRLHNMLTVFLMKREKILEQVAETRELYFDLISRLQMLLEDQHEWVASELRRMLEDVCDYAEMIANDAELLTLYQEQIKAKASKEHEEELVTIEYLRTHHPEHYRDVLLRLLASASNVNTDPFKGIPKTALPQPIQPSLGLN